MGISSIVNVLLWLEFELAYYNVTDQYVSHDVTGTPPKQAGPKQKIKT